MQALLTGILKKLIEWVALLAKKWWDRKQEQKSRHSETDAKVEDFKKASDQDAKKKFETLPILVLFALMSCTTPDRNRSLVVEQCSPNFAFETVEILREGVPGAETILDMAKSECYCRRYKYSLAFMGPIAGSVVTHRIEKCDRLVGNPPDDYARAVKFFGDVRQDIQDNSKR